MRKAAVRSGFAIELNGMYRIPNPRFVDKAVIQFRKNRLLFYADRIISPPVKTFIRNTVEVPHTGERNPDEF